MNIPKNCKYSESHEWVRLEGSEATIGITDYAQGELGDIVYVELPEIGAELSVGEECGMIDSAKTTSPLLSPISGIVTGINEELADHPELVNQSPYDEGWMFVIEPENTSDIKQLMSADEYKEFLEENS